MNQQANVPIGGEVEGAGYRVGEAHSNQLVRNGHYGCVADLNQFAELGLRTLRHPGLGENVASGSLNQPDWRWPDERLARLRELGSKPVVGLVHHRSGPRSTAFDQASFASGLARYAGLVAVRCPWVRYYTSATEPLMTTRSAASMGCGTPAAPRCRPAVQAVQPGAGHAAGCARQLAGEPHRPMGANQRPGSSPRHAHAGRAGSV